MQVREINAISGQETVRDMTQKEISGYEKDLPPSVGAPPSEAIIQSPNGTRFKIMVGDDGALTTEEIAGGE